MGRSPSSRATSRHTRSVDRFAQWRSTLTSIRRASSSATSRRNREVLSPLGFRDHEKAISASRHVRLFVYLRHCCMSEASVPCHTVATCSLSKSFLASMTGCTVMWCFSYDTPSCTVVLNAWKQRSGDPLKGTKVELLFDQGARDSPASCATSGGSLEGSPQRLIFASSPISPPSTTLRFLQPLPQLYWWPSHLCHLRLATVRRH